MATWKLELRIRCASLKKLDALSKSDPVVQVFLKQRTPSFVEIGCTEMIKNDHNPEFKTVITFDYAFNELQELKFIVSDADDKGTKKELIGEAEVVVGRMMALPGQRFVGDLTATGHKKRRGVIFVTATAFNKANTHMIELGLRGETLEKKDFMGKSDPFYRIFRKEIGVVDSHAWTKVAESEVIKKDLNPTWKPLRISDATLCCSIPTTPLRIDVFDWDADSDPDFIGSVTTSLGELFQAAATKKPFELINQKKVEHGNTKHGLKFLAGKYVNSGLLHIDTCVAHPPPPSFMDYLAGGLEISVIVAVDFTGSNGLPKYPTSLHYINPNPAELNQYQNVLLSVGNILSAYDADQMFPMFGFGGQMPDGSTSHCFSMTGNPNDPFCRGVTGMMQTYSTAIQQFHLSGPTNFAPIIHAAANIARTRTGPRPQYSVLLIITDGEICDMPDTVREIVGAATLPLSLIIVGVGKADFTNMNVLDGDVRPLRDAMGNPAARDIVQFVAYRDFNPREPNALAAAVLAELPAQVVEHFQRAGIAPPPPIAAPQINPEALE